MTYGHDLPCCKCGETCDVLAADPGKWPLALVPVWRECEPGKPEVHCSACVHAMMAAARPRETWGVWKYQAPLFIGTRDDAVRWAKENHASGGPYHVREIP